MTAVLIVLAVGKRDIGVDRDRLAGPHVDGRDAHLPFEGPHGLLHLSFHPRPRAARLAGHAELGQSGERQQHQNLAHRGTIPARFSLQTTLYLAHTSPVPCVEPAVLELMDDTTTLGAYLRAERERRDLALRTISETTKVSLPLLEGLESDDISRWPGGIFRRAFVRSYAEAVGLDPDEIFKRFERQHRPPTADGPFTEVGQPPADVVALAQAAGVFRGRGSFSIVLDQGPLSRHGRRHGRRHDPGLRQRCCRVAATVAGVSHRGLLCRRHSADGHQPDGGAPRRDRYRAPELRSAGRRRRMRRRSTTSTRCWGIPPHALFPDAAAPHRGIGIPSSSSWCSLCRHRVPVVNRLHSLIRETRRKDL